MQEFRIELEVVDTLGPDRHPDDADVVVAAVRGVRHHFVQVVGLATYARFVSGANGIFRGYSRLLIGNLASG